MLVILGLVGLFRVWVFFGGAAEDGVDVRVPCRVIVDVFEGEDVTLAEDVDKAEPGSGEPAQNQKRSY